MCLSHPLTTVSTHNFVPVTIFTAMVMIIIVVVVVVILVMMAFHFSVWIVSNHKYDTKLMLDRCRRRRRKRSDACCFCDWRGDAIVFHWRLLPRWVEIAILRNDGKGPVSKVLSTSVLWELRQCLPLCYLVRSDSAKEPWPMTRSFVKVRWCEEGPDLFTSRKVSASLWFGYEMNDLADFYQ